MNIVVEQMQGNVMHKLSVVKEEFKDRVTSLELEYVDESKPNQKSRFETLEIPREISRNMIEIAGTVYSLTNGLVLRTGPYVKNLKGSTKRSELTFKHKDDNIIKFEVRSTEKGATIQIRYGKNSSQYFSLLEFMMALQIVKNEGELISLFPNHANIIMKSIQDGLTKDTRVLKTNFDYVFSNLYTGVDRINKANELYHRTFNRFFGTDAKFLTKPIFFSWFNYRGCKVLGPSAAVNYKDKIINELVSRDLDNNKIETLILQDPCGKVIEVTRNFQPDFCSEDLVYAINYLMDCFCGSAKESDINAMYNLRLFSFHDYMEEYVRDQLQKKLSSMISTSVTKNASASIAHQVEPFTAYMHKRHEKVLSAVSMPNSAEYNCKEFKFARDVFMGYDKNIEVRLLNMTHLEWLSVITSDGDKCGLTGVLFEDTITDRKLKRPYIKYTPQIDLDELAETDKSAITNVSELFDLINSMDGLLVKEVVYLEPYEVFNKVIGYVSKDGITTKSLNGVILEEAEDITPELICYVDKLTDKFTGPIISKNSNHPKRDLLGNKTISQAMPIASSKLHKKVGMKTKFSDEKVGISVKDMVEFTLKNVRYKDLKIEYTDQPILIDSVDIVKRQDSRLEEYVIRFELCNLRFEYRHPRFLNAPNESTRLYCSVNAEKNKEYTGKDYILLFEGYENFSQECNILFGNLDGGTYEDGSAITSNFAKRMGLCTKLYSPVKIEIKSSIQKLNEEEMEPGFDEYGLPVKGKFIIKGDLLLMCKTEERNIHREYSEDIGYVSAIDIKSDRRDTVIRITLLMLRPLEIGDKVSNGHGNKGVVMQIIDSDKLMLSNGQEVDMIINPLGPYGRMNMGQLKEMLLHNIPTENGVRLYVEETDYENKTFSELIDKKNEVVVFYKGTQLKSDFYLGKINMYRSKNISTSHMNYVDSSSLTINHVVDRGQRMSELSTLVFDCYGEKGQEVINYLRTYQSKSKFAYNRSKASNKMDKPIQGAFNDVSIIRINAFLSALGMRMTDSNLEFITADEINNLNSVVDFKNALNSTKYTRTSIDRLGDYALKEKIATSSKIILPGILANLLENIPFRIANKSGLQYFTRKKDSKGSYCNKICGSNGREEKLLFRIDKETGLIVVVTENMVGSDTSLYGTGYFEFIKALCELDLNKTLDFVKAKLEEGGKDDKLPKAYKSIVNLLSLYGEDVFSKFAYSGIPLAPDNIRPIDKKTGESRTDINIIYRAFLGNNSDCAIYDSLCELENYIMNKLTNHAGSPESYMMNSIGEKNSELRDNMLARRYTHSGRSVVTADNTLEIYEIGLPYELFIGCSQDVIKSRLDIDKCEKYMQMECNYSSIKKYFNRMISRMPLNPDKGDFDYYDLAEAEAGLKIVCQDLADEMVALASREPTLRRQNLYAYRIILHDGVSIKLNPAVCESYNLDFDGDQMGIFMIMDKQVANTAMEIMSPVQGVMDGVSDKVWFELRQDQLLGIYKATKPYKNTRSHLYIVDEARQRSQIYTFTLKCMEPVVVDLMSGRIGYGDIITVRCGKKTLTTTVGKALVISTISNLFEHDTKILDVIKEPVTNKTANTVLKCQIDIHGITKELGKSIKRINDLGFFICTIEGVTLNPNVIGETLSSEFSANIQKTESDLLTRLGRSVKLDRCFITSTQNNEKVAKLNETQLKINVEKSETISDIINSGSRGKMKDLTQVFTQIGRQSYGSKFMEINGNYDKGVSYIEKFKMSLPVRQSNVSKSTSLGREGENLRKSTLLGTSLRYDGVFCGVSPSKYVIRYEYKLDGVNLRDINIKFDEILDKELIDCFKDYVSVDGEYIEYFCNNEFSGALITNLLNDIAETIYDLPDVTEHVIDKVIEINGKSLTKTISEFSFNLIQEKNLMYKNDIVLGSEVYSSIVSDNSRVIYFYNAYNCGSTKGVCKICHGKNGDIPGNLGANAILAMGQEQIQNKLDASKSTSGSNTTREVSSLDLFEEGNVKDYFKIKQEICPILTGGCTVRPEDKQHPNMYVLLQDFIPTNFGNLGHDLINFTELRDSNLNLTDRIDIEAFNMHMYRVYLRYMESLSHSMAVRIADLMISINARYVATVKTNSYENETVTGIDIKPFSKDTKDCLRYWLCKSELIKAMDPIYQLFLPRSKDNIYCNALTKRKIENKGIFSEFTGIFFNTDYLLKVKETSKFMKNDDKLILRKSMMTKSASKKYEEPVVEVKEELPETTTEFEQDATVSQREDVGRTSEFS